MGFPPNIQSGAATSSAGRPSSQEPELTYVGLSSQSVLPLYSHAPNTALPVSHSPFRKLHWWLKAFQSCLPLLSSFNSYFYLTVWSPFPFLEDPLYSTPCSRSVHGRPSGCLLDVPCQGTSLSHALLESSPVKLHVYHPPPQTTFYRSPFRYKHGLPQRK